MLDNQTDRTLFQLGTLPSELRSAILHHGPCRPKLPFAISSDNGNRRIVSGGGTLPCTFWDYGNRTAITLLITNDEEAILSTLLVFSAIHRQCKMSGLTVCRATRRTSE